MGCLVKRIFQALATIEDRSDAVFWGATRHATSLQRLCGVCIDGHRLDRDDILANATVGAGSSRFSRRFPRPSCPPSGLQGRCAGVKIASYPAWVQAVGLFPSWIHSARYLRGVEAGILSLRGDLCKSPVWGQSFIGGFSSSCE